MHPDSFTKGFVFKASTNECYFYGGILIMLWLAELIYCWDKAHVKWVHLKTNASFLLTALTIQLALTPGLIGLSNYVTGHHIGLIYLLPGHNNHWVFDISLFFMLDLCEYGYHVTMHKLKPLWKFHLVHHTDPQVDVSTTVREHPCETFIRGCFLMFWALLCGATPEVLVIRQTFQTVFNISSHTEFRLKGLAEKILGWIFITPNLHHVHHHYMRPQTDCNYGDVLSIWDRLFGTYKEQGSEETIFGLDTHMHIESRTRFLEILLIPFKKT